MALKDLTAKTLFTSLSLTFRASIPGLRAGRNEQLVLGPKLS